MGNSLVDEKWSGMGGRIIDIGGAVDPAEEAGEDYSGKNLIVCALDPGETTGWSALKVPVASLAGRGVARTLPRCRWRHGQILRSGGVGGSGPMGQAVSDSKHVDLILEQCGKVYEDMVFDLPDYVADRTEDEEEYDLALAEYQRLGWESDVFVFVIESFSLRMMSMDTNLLSPVRVMDRILDRMYMMESEMPVFFQSPADAKNVVTNTRLRSWGMYDPASGEHARDADRHAILFLRRFAESQELQAGLGFSS